jgi:hypothetical protein
MARSFSISCEAEMFLADHLVGEKAGPLQPEWTQHQLLQRSLIGLAGQRLEQAAGDHERGIVVGEELAGRRQLRQLFHGRHVARQRVVAAAEVAVVISHPAGAVVHELAHRHGIGGGFIQERKARQIRAHRCSKIDLSLLDQAHHRRGREGFGG